MSIWIILNFKTHQIFCLFTFTHFSVYFFKSLILNVITYMDVWKPVASPDRMMIMRIRDKLNCIGSRIIMIFFFSCWNNYTVVFGPLWCTNCLRAIFLINNVILQPYICFARVGIQWNHRKQNTTVINNARGRMNTTNANSWPNYNRSIPTSFELYVPCKNLY